LRLRQHGTFTFFVGSFFARPGDRRTYKGEEILNMLLPQARMLVLKAGAVVWYLPDRLTG